MRAVDTNVLVRLITRDDSRQVAAAEAFVRLGAWVSHLALAEAAWVLDAVYERGPAEVAKAIEILLNHQHLTIQDHEVVAAALDRFRQQPRLGFVLGERFGQRALWEIHADELAQKKAHVADTPIREDLCDFGSQLLRLGRRFGSVEQPEPRPQETREDAVARALRRGSAAIGSKRADSVFGATTCEFFR